MRVLDGLLALRDTRFMMKAFTVNGAVEDTFRIALTDIGHCHGSIKHDVYFKCTMAAPAVAAVRDPNDYSH